MFGEEGNSPDHLAYKETENLILKELCSDTPVTQPYSISDRVIAQVAISYSSWLVSDRNLAETEQRLLGFG